MGYAYIKGVLKGKSGCVKNFQIFQHKSYAYIFLMVPIFIKEFHQSGNPALKLNSIALHLI